MKLQIPFITLAAALFLPFWVQAQTLNQDVQQLHTVLEKVYDQMIPLCEQLTTVARAIAGFAATFYIGYRVWRHIAAAEAIDFFPLLRPFVLTLLIAMFPKVLGVINGILKPTVTATAKIVTNSNDAVHNLLDQREAAIKKTTEWQVLVGPTGDGDRQAWYKYTHPNSTEGYFTLGNDVVFEMDKFLYNLRYAFKYLISVILEIIYYAAGLCIDTIRTFHLIVLAILGPLVFALAVFDGFQQSLSQWLARYVNIYMWLPVCNLFGAILGKIQENMLKIDLSQLQHQGTTVFTSTDAAYLIFLIIGTIGYLTVPGIANYIVHAHVGNPLLQKVSNISGSVFSSGFRSVNPYSSNTVNSELMTNKGGGSSGNTYNKSKISG